MKYPVPLPVFFLCPLWEISSSSHVRNWCRGFSMPVCVPYWRKSAFISWLLRFLVYLLSVNYLLASVFSAFLIQFKTLLKAKLLCHIWGLNTVLWFTVAKKWAQMRDWKQIENSLKVTRRERVSLKSAFAFSCTTSWSFCVRPFAGNPKCTNREQQTWQFLHRTLFAHAELCPFCCAALVFWFCLGTKEKTRKKWVKCLFAFLSSSFPCCASDVGGRTCRRRHWRNDSLSNSLVLHPIRSSNSLNTPRILAEIGNGWYGWCFTFNHPGCGGLLQSTTVTASDLETPDPCITSIDWIIN